MSNNNNINNIFTNTEKLTQLLTILEDKATNGGGVDTSDATATPETILDGYTAYVNGEKVVGTKTFTLQEKVVTENGTITMDEGYDGISQVTIDVQPILQPLEVTENDTYIPANDFDGFDMVVVDVQPNLQELEITRSGSYVCTPDEGFDGFSSIVVNIEESSSGGVSGDELPQLYSPRVAIASTGMLTVSDDQNGSFVDNYALYMNDEEVMDSIPSDGVSLYDLSTEYTTYSVRAQSRGSKFNPSELSAEKTWWNSDPNGTPGLAYTLSSDGTYYSCSGMGDATDVEDICIASTYQNIPVKYVSASAFENNTTIRTMTLPYSITNIGNKAFYKCTSLEEINIPNSVTYLGQDCFSYTKIERLVIPGSLSTLGNYAIRNQSSLKTLIMEEGVKSFNGTGSTILSASLDRLELPSTFTSYGRGSISGTWTNVNYNGTLEQWARTSGNFTQNGYLPEASSIPGHSKNFYISGKKVGEHLDLSKASGVGTMAFSFMPQIKSVYFGDVIPTSSYPFYRSVNIEKLTVSPNSKATVKLVDNCVLNSSGTTLYWGCKNAKIPETVTSIYEYAFLGQGIDNLILPDTVTTWGGNGNGCQFAVSTIKNLILSNNLTSIPGYSLMSTNLSGGIVVFGEKIASIGNYTFYSSGGNYKLDFSKAKQVPTLSSYHNIPTSVEIKVPRELYQAWGTATNWSAIAGQLVLEFSDEATEGLVYELSSDGSYAICSSDGDVSLNVINIDPIYENRLFVEIIGKHAFQGNHTLQEVTIPTTIKEIEEQAFQYCDGLTDVSIPNSTKYINDYAFDGCSSLQRIILGDRLEIIGDYAFSNCSDVEILNIPANVECIGQYAFYNCSSLKYVDFSSHTKVPSISTTTFLNTSEDLEIKVPESLYDEWVSNEEWQEVANKIVTKLSCDGTDGLVYTLNSDKKSAYLSGKGTTDGVEDIVVSTYYKGAKVTKIGYQVFKDNTTLKSIQLPETITQIDSWAFYGCTGLTSIELPSSLTKTDSLTFSNCSNLTTLKLHSAISFGDRAFEGCGNMREVHIDSISDWLNSGFSSNSSNNPMRCNSNVTIYLNGQQITSVEIPKGTTTIKDCVLYNFKQLQNITIPTTITKIDQYAFYNCSSLQNIELPESLETISQYAFGGCSGLTSINIPNNVTSIGSKSFYGCGNLVEMHLSRIPNNVPLGYLFGTSQYTNSYSATQKEASDFYSRGYYIPNGLKKVVVNSGNLYYTAFSNCKSIEQIVLGDEVQSIGDSAFSSCTNLTQIKIPMGVPSIGSSTFYNCSSLQSIDIPNSVTSIGTDAFRSCSSLTSLVIPNSVVEIGKTALLYSGVESLSIPFIGANIDGQNNTHFGYIYGCDSYSGQSNSNYVPTRLSKVIVTGPIKKVDNYAFYGCSGITSITLPNGVENIGTRAFSNLSKLTNISIPNSVKKVGSELFYSSSSTIYNVVDNLRYVGNNDNPHVLLCGANNSSITSATIQDGCKVIGYQAFSGYSKLVDIHIPDSVVSVSSNAFNNCSALNDVYIVDMDAWHGIEFENAQANPLYYATNLYCDNQLVENITLSNSISRIGDYSFYNYETLKSIELSNTINSIGRQAFYGCGGVEFNEYEGCKYLGTSTNPYYALVEVIDTTQSQYTIHNDTKVIIDYAFSGCTNLTNIDIPNNVIGLGRRAFDGCTNLESIVIGNGVESINDYTFYNCSKLSSVSIGENVNNIGQYAFYGCTSITSIELPNTLKSIGKYSFSECSGLTNIYIPESVDYIEYGAFYNCSSLQSMAIPFIGYSRSSSNCMSVFGYIFGYKISASNSSVPNATYQYSCGSNSDYYYYYIPATLRQVTILGCEKIRSNAFYNCVGINVIELQKDVTTIENNAFYGCTSLQTLKLNKDLSTIEGSNAFYNCTSLSNIYIEDLSSWCNLQGIEYLTQQGATRKNFYLNGEEMSSIDIPSDIKTIKAHTFRNCANLYSINIPDTIETIESSAFYGCANLSTINLPFVGESRDATGYKQVFGYIFGDTTQPNSSTISGATYQYSSGSNYYHYYIPTSITSVVVRGGQIRDNAFYNCSNLVFAWIRADVSYVGNKAFYGCSKVTIACDIDSFPIEWSAGWNPSNKTVLWGYTAQDYTYKFVSTIGDEIQDIVSNMPIVLPIPNEVEGYHFMGWYDNEEFTGKAITSYFNNCDATFYAKWYTEEQYIEEILKGTSFDYAETIAAGETKDVTIKTAGAYYYFKIVPIETRSYTIASIGSVDTYGHLYNSSRNQVAYDDDGAGNRQFRISYTLNANETYYIGARYYSTSTTGTFQVKVT